MCGCITHPLGFVDAWAAADGEDDRGYTAVVKGEPAKLDYAVLSASLCDRIRSCLVDRDADGSDQQPLWLDVG